MHIFVIIFLGFSYLLLTLELTFFHVPSFANTKNFFEIQNSTELSKSQMISKVRKWTLSKKITLLILPNVIVIIVHLLPLYYLYTYNQFINHNNAVVLTGLILVVISRIFGLYTVNFLRVNNKQSESSFDLKTNSVYYYSRNPVTDAMLIFFIGNLIIFPNLIFAIGIIIYFIHTRFRILIEEDFLKSYYGLEYEKYRMKTKRFLFLW